MNTTSATASASTTATDQGSGNAQLWQAFQEAIAEATRTLIISVAGQAKLNALRARPN